MEAVYPYTCLVPVVNDVRRWACFLSEVMTNVPYILAWHHYRCGVMSAERGTAHCGDESCWQGCWQWWKKGWMEGRRECLREGTLECKNIDVGEREEEEKEREREKKERGEGKGWFTDRQTSRQRAKGRHMEKRRSLRGLPPSRSAARTHVGMMNATKARQEEDDVNRRTQMMDDAAICHLHALPRLRLLLRHSAPPIPRRQNALLYASSLHKLHCC